MTVASTTSKVTYAGNGSTTSFTVPFYFLANTHLKVILRSAAGIETTKTLTTDYTVSGVGSPSGGTITMLVAPASGETLAILRNVPYTQETDYQSNDPFPAQTHEQALDKLTMETQQLAEQANRALTLPASLAGGNTELPAPVSNNLIGWNSDLTGLQNVDPTTLATIVAFGTAKADTFSGNGSTTAFTLTSNPGALNNLDVSISGVSQRNGLDFTWSGGTTLTFTSAPASGTNNILVRYLQALPQGSTDSASATFIQSGTGAVARIAQDKMRECISVKDFGAVGDFNGTTGTDNYTAIQAAINYLFSKGGGTLYFPKGFYRITQALNLTGNGTLGRSGNTPIIFKGDGMPNAFDTGSWSTYGGSWIVGQTGNWIMDCTGLQYFTCEEMGFRGTGTNASVNGVLTARSTSVKFAHCQTFRKCVIWVDTAPTATAVGSIALANNGTETFVVEQSWLISDTPLALTFNNSTDLNLVSPYVSIEYGGGYLSSTMMNFRNTTFFALTGYANRIQGVNDAFFDTCIWSKAAGNTTNYGIQLISGQSGTAHCQDLRFTGQVEVFGGAFRIDDTNPINIDANIMMPDPTAAYVSTGSVSLTNCVFNIHNIYGSSVQPVFNAGFACNMYGGEIHVYPGGSVTANSNLTTFGTIIRGHNVDLSGALGLASGSTYLATGSTGISVSPPAGLSIPPNTSNNATASSSPNVPTSYLRSDGFVQLSGSFTPNGATTIAAGTQVGVVALAHRPNREVDGTVYIAGTTAYCRVLTTGGIYFGAPVTAGQLANIDGFTYKLNN